MARTMFLLVIGLLDVTASAGRFSDTDKNLLTAGRKLRSVKYGTKTQIDDAKLAVKAALLHPRSHVRP